MTDYAQTITNHLGVYGIALTNKWGTLEWGTDNWAYQDEFGVEIGKVIAESTTNTTTLLFDVDKIIAETATLTDTIVNDFVLAPIEESITLTSVQDGITLVDSAGFYHVFRGNTTEGEDQVVTSYTEASDASGTWTAESTTSTTWS